MSHQKKLNVKEYMIMKRKKMNNKGFTLVELIVVLVILAILAAILVPTLMGYIDKARSEKDFGTAQAIRVATQSMIAEMYGKGEEITATNVKGHTKEIMGLIGAGTTTAEGGATTYTLDGQALTLESVDFEDAANKNYQIKQIVVTIDGKKYRYSSVEIAASGTVPKQEKNTWAAIQ